MRPPRRCSLWVPAPHAGATARWPRACAALAARSLLPAAIAGAMAARRWEHYAPDVFALLRHTPVRNAALLAPWTTSRLRPMGRDRGRARLRAAGSEGDFEDPDMEVDMELEDDWASQYTIRGTPRDPRDNSLEAVQEREGISDEEAALYKKGAEALMAGGEFPPEILAELGLGNFAPESALESFEGIGGGASDKWLEVPLNDTR